METIRNINLAPQPKEWNRWNEKTMMWVKHKEQRNQINNVFGDIATERIFHAKTGRNDPNSDV